MESSGKSTCMSTSSLSSTSSSSDLEMEEKKNRKAKSVSLSKSSKSSKTKSLLTSENSSLTSVQKNAIQTITSPSAQHQSNLTIRQLIENNLNQDSIIEKKPESDTEQAQNVKAKSTSQQSSRHSSITKNQQHQAKSASSLQKSKIDLESSSSESDDEEKNIKAKPRSNESQTKISRSSLINSPSQNLIDNYSNGKLSRNSLNRTPVISSTPFSPALNREDNAGTELAHEKSLNTSVSSGKQQPFNLDHNSHDPKSNALSPIVPDLLHASQSRKNSNVSFQQTNEENHTHSKTESPSKSVKSIEKLTYSRTSIARVSNSSSDSDSEHETKSRKASLNTSKVPDTQIDKISLKSEHKEEDRTSNRSRISTKLNSKPTTPEVRNSRTSLKQSVAKNGSSESSEEEELMKQSLKAESKKSLTSIKEPDSQSKKSNSISSKKDSIKDSDNEKTEIDEKDEKTLTENGNKEKKRNIKLK